MLRVVEQMLETMTDKGQEEYAVAYVSAFKMAMSERGKLDGAAAAEHAPCKEPNSAILRTAAEEYAISFFSGYTREIKSRGTQDGANAAIGAPVDGIVK